MKTWSEAWRMTENGELDSVFKKMGCSDCKKSQSRTLQVLEGFQKSFGEVKERKVTLCSAPGRTEIGGNHTDHQRGNVLAAAVTMDFLACASLNGTKEVRFQSKGWPLTKVDISKLEVVEAEKESTAALIRGILAKMSESGYKIEGFDLYTDSEVLPGSGLSSSAACEVMIGVVGNHLFCGDHFNAVEIAKIGQYAENVYFGKPSGLMDQMASSVGSAVAIDFKDPKAPVIKPVEVDLEKLGYALCIIDSGADHAALTGEYASIPVEMGAVAGYFGKEVLRDVEEEAFIEALPEIRKKAGDRAVLRALHFYAENKRAVEEAEALKKGDMEGFLQLLRESGKSSWELLQNITPTGAVEHQDMALAITIAERLLGKKGACRIHGGGFAGTLQAFVPIEELDSFREKIEKLLAKGCCHVLDIRNAGGIVVLP